MTSTKYTISNKVGLHARPASLFVRRANEFQSRIHIRTEQMDIDAKSILSVMSLGAGRGTVIEIVAEGPDEKQAIHALVEVLDSFLKQYD